MRGWWIAGVLAALGYGIFLTVTAWQSPPGAELTGRFWAQPAVKSAMAVALAVAAAGHPIPRERRWLVAALLFGALGDVLLAIPWWRPAFVCGLGAFLVAHLCYLAVLIPLRGRVRGPGLAAVVLVVAGCLGMLVRFWPALSAEAMTVPVTVYVTVLGAMVCAALIARLPTWWTAAGAVLFAVSDGMIGVGTFLLGTQALEVPIWWVYAAAQVLITAGLLFGRTGR